MKPLSGLATPKKPMNHQAVFPIRKHFVLNRLLTLIGVVAFTAAANGKPRTEAELKAAATLWMTGHPVMGTAPREIVQIDTYPDGNTPGAVKVVHLSPAGTLILNSDDRLPLVAGFSEEPVTVDGNESPTFAAMLVAHVQNAANELAAGTTAPKPTAKAAPAPDYVARVYIAPLLKSSWNQCAPYNYYMPHNAKDPIPSVNKYRASTGCGTTAMAQVLNFYQWPPYGEGKMSHTDAQGKLQSSFETDFGHHYGWDLIKNSFDPNATGAGAQAVGQLCYDVAVAGRIDNEPGVSAINLNEASNNFVNHMFYEAGEWVIGDATGRSAIVENLKKKIPVPADIGIDNKGNGHAIVFDGLLIENGSTSYHTNYGWGGSNNIWWDERSIISVWQSQTGLRPALVPLPPKETCTVKNGTKWELPWKIARQRLGDIQKITLYQAVSKNTTWTNACETLPDMVETRSWSLNTGYSGNCWFANSPYPVDQLIVDGTFTPSNNATLTFREKHVCIDNSMTVEASVNGGEFQPLLTFGKNVQNNWTTRSIPLGSFAGKKLRLRFYYKMPGASYYYSTEQGGGFWIDDLTITGCTTATWEKMQLTGEITESNGHNSTSTHLSRWAYPAGKYTLCASLTDTTGKEHRLGAPFTLNVVENIPTAELRISSGGDVKRNGDLLKFGSVRVNNTSIRTITLKNTGNLPIKGIKLSNGGENPKDFSISQTSSSLAPGDTITVKIRFSPSRNGSRAAVLRSCLVKMS
jgi:hypothetical protein